MSFPFASKSLLLSLASPISLGCVLHLDPGSLPSYCFLLFCQLLSLLLTFLISPFKVSIINQLTMLFFVFSILFPWNRIFFARKAH